MNSKSNRLPLFSHFVTKDGNLHGIEFEGNIITKLKLTPDNSAVVVFRRVDGLEFDEELKLTTDCHKEVFKEWDEEGFDDGDFALMFKKPDNLRSVVSNLQKVLEIQLNQESEVSND